MTTKTFDPGPEWVEAKNNNDATLILFNEYGAYLKGWEPRPPLPTWTVAIHDNRHIVKTDAGWWVHIYSGDTVKEINETKITILSRPVETDK